MLERNMLLVCSRVWTSGQPGMRRSIHPSRPPLEATGRRRAERAPLPDGRCAAAPTGLSSAGRAPSSYAPPCFPAPPARPAHLSENRKTAENTCPGLFYKDGPTPSASVPRAASRRRRTIRRPPICPNAAKTADAARPSRLSEERRTADASSPRVADAAAGALRIRPIAAKSRGAAEPSSYGATHWPFLAPPPAIALPAQGGPPP